MSYGLIIHSENSLQMGETDKYYIDSDDEKETDEHIKLCFARFENRKGRKMDEDDLKQVSENFEPETLRLCLNKRRDEDKFFSSGSIFLFETLR